MHFNLHFYLHITIFTPYFLYFRYHFSSISIMKQSKRERVVFDTLPIKRL